MFLLILPAGLFLGILGSSEYLMAQPWTGGGLGRLPGRAPPACTPWIQVNDRGFGLPSLNPGGDGSRGFENEEGFEVLVFADRLYVGMEADNSLGARLWRTRTPGMLPSGQPDWEEVIADARGLPWGIENLSQVDHIDSLAAFDGYLYASSANAGDPAGTVVFRSLTGDPGSWEDALETIGPGFGRSANENFKDMIEFDEALCGGTWNETGGAEVWCTADGTAWAQKSPGGFGDPGNAVIWSSDVFNGGLYFGVEHRQAGVSGAGGRTARVFRTHSLADPVGWEPVFEGEPGSVSAVILGESGSSLYIATAGRDGIRIYRSTTGDAGSWIPASLPGMANTRWNTTTVTDGAVEYQDTLFVSVINPLIGFRVWKLVGDDFWEVVPAAASYDPQDFAAQLAVFKGALFAWTSNDHAGQAVLQTTCAPP
ncbi:MAG TPA: hypothetical protein VMN57_04350 [Anaerolineales bacterium]|nr:hypothetical protein [Anaerolineales bacterium]